MRGHVARAGLWVVALVVLSGLVSAPVGAVEPSEVTAGEVVGAPVSADPVARRARPRTGLRVRVALPSRTVRARVQVRGPRGYRRVVRRTTTLAVRPGAYSVRALTSSGSWGTAYPARARKAKQRVRVRRGKRATARVSYDTLVARRTRVLRPSSIRRVTGFASARAGLLREQAWSASGGVGPRLLPARESVVTVGGAARYRAGDVLAAGITRHTPVGLLGRVVDVARRGDASAYTVRPVPISEAVPVGDLRAQLALSTARLREAPSSRRERACDPASGSVTVQLEPDVVDVDFQAHLGARPSRTRMRIEVTADLDATVKAEAKVGTSCTQSTTLWQKRFGPRVVTLGPVPVVYEPELNVSAFGTIEASGAFSSRTEVSRRVTEWLEVSGSGVDSGEDAGDLVTRTDPFDVAKRASGSFGVRAKASLVFYGLAGPYGQVSLAPSITADPDAETWLETKVVFGAELGIALDCDELWGPDVCPPFKASAGVTKTWDGPSQTKPQLAPVPGAIAGTPYGHALSTVDGRPGTWEKVGSWPAWLDLQGATLLGTPPRAGDATVGVRFVAADPLAAVAPLMNREFTVTVPVAAGAAPEIETDVLPDAEASVAYDAVLRTVDRRPGTWAVAAGAMPPGLDIVDGHVVGTPTRAGQYGFTVSFTDVADRTVTRPLSLRVVPRTPPEIITTSLPAGEENVEYVVALATADGRPGVWDVAAGTLPEGLVLSADGRLEGYPHASGTIPLSLRFTDDEAGRVATRDFSLVIAEDRSTLAPVPMPEGVGLASDPALSAGGRYVAYAAVRPEGLGPCRCSDVWLLDTVSGDTVRVSSAVGGGWSDGDSTRPAVSGDGSSVVFTSEASDVAPGAPGTAALFRWDRTSGVTTLVTVLPVPDGDGTGPGRALVSADGNLVFFEVWNDYDVSVHVRDLATGATTNLTPGPSPYGLNTLQDISTDGRFVAIQSDGVESPSKVRVIDRSTGQLLAPPRDGENAQDEDDDQTSPVLSPDGRLAVFAWFDTWRFDPGKVQQLRRWDPLTGAESSVEGFDLRQGLHPVALTSSGQVVVAPWPGGSGQSSRVDEVAGGGSRQIGGGLLAVGASDDGAVVLLTDATPDLDGHLVPGTLTLWRPAP